MNKNKKKIIFGLSLIIAAILCITVAVCVFGKIPNTTTLMTRDGLMFMGGFMLCAIGCVGLVGGVCMIADGLDLF